MVADTDLGSLGRERVEEALLSEAVFPVEPVSQVSISYTDRGCWCPHLSRSSCIHVPEQSATNPDFKIRRDSRWSERAKLFK